LELNKTNESIPSISSPQTGTTNNNVGESDLKEDEDHSMNSLGQDA
jgi:hypothetical protein